MGLLEVSFEGGGMGARSKMSRGHCIAEDILSGTDKICYWAGESIGESFLTNIARESAVQSTMTETVG